MELFLLENVNKLSLQWQNKITHSVCEVEKRITLHDRDLDFTLHRLIHTYKSTLVIVHADCTGAA